MKLSPFISSVAATLLMMLAASKTSAAQTLFINELMASNSKTITDPDYHEYGDWIEIYNSGASSVNLKGFSITDLFSQPKKYVFATDVTVPSNGYLIVWADDHATGNHANFKLSGSGEMVGLYDSSGKIIDTVTFGAQANDISYGRFPNGTANWYKFSPASPGSANIDSQISNRLVVPQLSFQSGFYASAIDVKVSHPDSAATLRYTLNGKTPAATSPVCSTLIHIDSTLVVRVRAFRNGYVTSNTVTSTYFLREQTELPVFSLVTDPENFFSDTSGIYVEGTNGIIANCSTGPRNWNQDWERPVELEFFEKDRKSAFKVSTGVKIFGGCARLYPEKSLAFYFRGDYGFDVLKYRLFPDIPLTEYNNFVLRSSGQDWWRTMFRDGMAQTLIGQGMNVDHQDYRPSILFINGQYWGIHNIREKLNEHYVYFHYGTNPDSIDLVEISKGITANNGTLEAYNSMINFLSTNNMALSANYNYIKSIADIDEYIDYNVSEIYSANGDWPGANMKIWRERTPAGKWRWMVYDLDFTLGGNTQGQSTTNTLDQATATNGPSWPNPPWATLMLRKLLENTEFKNEFIQRFAAHLNTTYDKDHINALIDTLTQRIAAEIPRHKIRWPQSISLVPTWAAGIQVMKDFAIDRPAAARGHFTAKFSITGTPAITISRNNPDWGKVYTQSVEVKTNGSANIFFRGIPLRVKALPMPGYRFVRWDGVLSSTVPETTIVPATNTTLTAVFEPAALSVTTPVINEINYKSSSLFDTEDWVEVYNPSSKTVDLSGWKLRDGSANTFSLPNNQTLNGHAYLVLCRDTVKFRSLRPEVNPILGNMGFGLSSSGELIQLVDSMGTVIDSVDFSSSGNWTPGPNGTGSTLSLINPQSDNALAENWKSSGLYGTPGKLNDVYTTGLGRARNEIPDEYALLNNYPNPFNASTVISFVLPEMTEARLIVYNPLGQRIRELVNSTLSRGYYQITFEAGSLSSGIYFYELATPKFRGIKKLLLLK